MPGKGTWFLGKVCGTGEWGIIWGKVHFQDQCGREKELRKCESGPGKYALGKVRLKKRAQFQRK